MARDRVHPADPPGAGLPADLPERLDGPGRRSPVTVTEPGSPPVESRGQAGRPGSCGSGP
ncbi:hypothetical protein SGPA1_40114 [Streptomyces misionensis JCM 4497]